MTTGVLFYNAENDRQDVRFGDGSTYGGFHCGDCLQALVDGKWIETRIEYSGDWFLVGLFNPGKIPCGLNVRI
ncbi:MAG: DUF5348 domain-containing protein [Oscillospiraceae bacterium]